MAFETNHSRRSFLAGGTAAAGLAPLGQNALAKVGMKHIILLGDSVLDNGAYVGNGPNVLAQLRGILPADWKADLHARDGAVMEEVPTQLTRAPATTTHIVISAGGNDALGYSNIFSRRAEGVAEALELLEAVRVTFRAAYSRILREALGRGLPVAVCTIYDPRYADPLHRKVSSAGLALLNDAISREAFLQGACLIDLRLICNEDEDFANPIEPSSHGGAKIASTILNFVEGQHHASVILK